MHYQRSIDIISQICFYNIISIQFVSFVILCALFHALENINLSRGPQAHRVAKGVPGTRHSTLRWRSGSVCMRASWLLQACVTCSLGESSLEDFFLPLLGSLSTLQYGQPCLSSLLPVSCLRDGTLSFSYFNPQHLATCLAGNKHSVIAYLNATLLLHVHPCIAFPLCAVCYPVLGSLAQSLLLQSTFQVRNGYFFLHPICQHWLQIFWSQLVGCWCPFDMPVHILGTSSSCYSDYNHWWLAVFSLKCGHLFQHWQRLRKVRELCNKPTPD